ncbi:MAG: 16S rRNA processing protein RimM [Treponema sp.]|jgi:16S rRNA processing protein RimM|nr:16S rRNA processing protein RimM [Treponema bryantii]MBO5118074.1 16S rRNA processing protein RimM [Treponema sp.]MBQ8776847.1 16S rRNA processing protein RimM [Treponema sp.]MBR6583984.1 16S rRNA processing protein RimM [Treponema sp.]
MEKAQLIVGFIRGSHGYSGECKVESASGEYEHLLNLKEVTLQHGNEKKETKVESVSLGCNTAYVKFAGINSDEDIRKYNRWEIVVPRKYCKPLKKDEWYIEDLRNCSLIYEEKGDSASLNAPAQVVGTITDVLEGGAGYLLEVSISESCNCISEELKKTSSGKPRTVLIPFNNEHVGKVDVKKGTIQLMHLWILE